MNNYRNNLTLSEISEMMFSISNSIYNIWKNEDRPDDLGEAYHFACELDNIITLHSSQTIKEN